MNILNLLSEKMSYCPMKIGNDIYVIGLNENYTDSYQKGINIYPLVIEGKDFPGVEYLTDFNGYPVTLVTYILSSIASYKLEWYFSLLRNKKSFGIHDLCGVSYDNNQYIFELENDVEPHKSIKYKLDNRDALRLFFFFFNYYYRYLEEEININGFKKELILSEDWEAFKQELQIFNEQCKQDSIDVSDKFRS